MTCTEVARLILASADGMLEAGERRALDAHTAVCAGCREQAEAQAAVAALLRSRPEQPVSRGFAARVVERLQSPEGWLDAVDWRKWTWRLSPAAAALLLAALFLPSGRATTSPAPGATAATDTTSIGIMESWAIHADRTALPATALLWQPNVSDDSLLVTVLTANPDADLGGNASGR